MLDCEGNDPFIENVTNPAPNAPNHAYTINGKNWLGDLIAANDPAGCQATADPDDEDNRTTRFDVVRMWWALRTDQGLTPAQLSNLAVNTCFATWSEDDSAGPTSDRMPLARFYDGASDLGLSTEVNAEDDHVVH